MTKFNLIHRQQASSFSRPAPPSIADIAAMVPAPSTVLEPVKKPVCQHGHLMVYLAGCSALAEIAQALGVYVLKVGTTGGNPLDRARSLGEKRYAGYWGTEGDLRRLPGAGHWTLFRLRTDNERHTLPTRLAQLTEFGHVRLEVPKTMRREHVDAAITLILEKRSLRSFLKSDEGRLRCRQAGIDPEAWFWTDYPERGQSAVQELFLFDPAKDVVWFLDALEALGAHLNR